MKRPDDDKWLDDAISRAIGPRSAGPDFAQWQQTHGDAVRALETRAAQGSHVAKTQPKTLWRTIMKNRVTKYAAAAAIIVVVLVSWTYLGRTKGGDTGRVPTGAFSLRRYLKTSARLSPSPSPLITWSLGSREQ